MQHIRVLSDGKHKGVYDLDAESNFPLFKKLFFVGIPSRKLVKEIIACEEFISHGGDLHACESYADVIKGLTSIYLQDTSKEHLRKYLHQRLIDDLEI
nr:hypothetical protein [Pseudomonas sp. s4]